MVQYSGLLTLRLTTTINVYTLFSINFVIILIAQMQPGKQVALVNEIMRADVSTTSQFFSSRPVYSASFTQKSSTSGWKGLQRRRRIICFLNSYALPIFVLNRSS